MPLIKRRYRLAVWITHPIQYQAPLLRKLAQHPQIELTAYYGSEHGAVERLDPEFGVSFRWDVPLLEGYKHKFLPNYSWKRTPTGFWWVVNPTIISELVRGQYDAIVIHGYASATSWLAYLGAWLTRTPVLFRGETVLRKQSGWKRAIKRLGLRFLFAHTAACLAIGRSSEEFYRAYGLPGSKVFLAPYCVDNDLFMGLGDYWRLRRGETRRELCLPESLPVILYCGKLIARKRPIDLVEAAARLSAPVGLLFVGDGPERRELEARARQRGLSYTRLVGFQNQSGLPRFYAAADVLAFPSEYEAYGLVVNEAMCSGLAIVTTSAVAATRDLVRDGENGFLVPVGDVAGLTRRLEQLVRDPAGCRAMGKRSREMVAEWSYQACVRSVVEAVERVARPSMESATRGA